MPLAELQGVGRVVGRGDWGRLLWLLWSVGARVRPRGKNMPCRIQPLAMGQAMGRARSHTENHTLHFQKKNETNNDQKKINAQKRKKNKKTKTHIKLIHPTKPPPLLTLKHPHPPPLTLLPTNPLHALHRLHPIPRPGQISLIPIKAKSIMRLVRVEFESVAAELVAEAPLGLRLDAGAEVGKDVVAAEVVLLVFPGEAAVVVEVVVFHTGVEAGGAGHGGGDDH